MKSLVKDILRRTLPSTLTAGLPRRGLYFGLLLLLLPGSFLTVPVLLWLEHRNAKKLVPVMAVAEPVAPAGAAPLPPGVQGGAEGRG